MASQPGVFAIFQTKAPVEIASRQEKPDLGDDTFRNVMDDVVRDNRSTRENSAPRAAREDSPSAASEQRPTDRTHDTTRSSGNNGIENQAGNTAAAESNAPQTVLGGPSGTESKDRLIERLQSLELTQEQIDALLELLTLDPEGTLDSLFEALASQLNLNLETGPSSLNNLLQQGSNNPSQQDLIALLQNQGNLVTDFLRQAGLTELEAKNLLEKFQLAAVDKSAIQSAAASKLQATHAAKISLQENIPTQTATPAVDDSKGKAGGEKNGQGKPDFFTQFNQPGNTKEAPAPTASIEKILDLSGTDPGKNKLGDAGEKTPFNNQFLKQVLSEGNNQATLIQAGNNNGAASKGSNGAKLATEFQIQNTSAIADSSAKTVEGAKTVLQATLPPRSISGSQVIDQILSKFSLRTSGGENVIKIRLDPPSLGTVRMNISTSGDSVRTVIVTDNAVVKQIIENNLSQLRDSMIGQGLKVDSFTVLVGGNSGQSGNQQAKQEEGFNANNSPVKAEVSSATSPTPSLVSAGNKDGSTIINVMA